MSLELYTNLKTISSFTQVTDLSHFIEIGAGWSVVLSDIRGSTKAIEEGRYKDINLLGVAMISSIQNVLGHRHFPFVFGGDGATALLPNEMAEQIRPALGKLQNLAKDQFGFDLRVGIVPLEEVLKAGGKILLAKYEVSPGNYLAMIQGGGLQIAERLIKDNPDSGFQLKPSTSNEAPVLTHLSCRWAPLQNRNGMMISLLVQAAKLAEAPQVYQQILTEIHPIFEIEVHRPVSLHAVKHENFFKNLRRELKLRQDLNFQGLLWQVFIPQLYTRVVSRFQSSPRKDELDNYMRDTMINSDYKKMDDSLRMVLDCSAAQAAQLEQVMSRHHANGTIFYGMHRSPAALMTCVMEGMGKDQHLHFIDGSDGGYAMAAKNLKVQIKAYSVKERASA